MYCKGAKQKCCLGRQTAADGNGWTVDLNWVGTTAFWLRRGFVQSIGYAVAAKEKTRQGAAVQRLAAVYSRSRSASPEPRTLPEPTACCTADAAASSVTWRRARVSPV